MTKGRIGRQPYRAEWRAQLVCDCGHVVAVRKARKKWEAASYLAKAWTAEHHTPNTRGVLHHTYGDESRERRPEPNPHFVGIACEVRLKCEECGFRAPWATTADAETAFRAHSCQAHKFALR